MTILRLRRTFGEQERSVSTADQTHQMEDIKSLCISRYAVELQASLEIHLYAVLATNPLPR